MLNTRPYGLMIEARVLTGRVQKICALTRLMKDLLFAVSATDPLIFIERQLGILAGFSQWSRGYSRPSPDGFAARALQSPTHGSLGARKGAANRGIHRDILLLVNNAREISKDNFYPAHMIDAATGAIHIFQAHAHSLDGSREFPKLRV